jgi:glycerate dehydrogenase
LRLEGKGLILVPRESILETTTNGRNAVNIIVLDGHTLNPGDLSWDPLRKLGTCRIYDRTPVDAVVERASQAEILLTNKTPISRDAVAALPRLRYIGVLATGYNIVDAEAARQRNIPVTNVPTYGASSVSQMVFAHLLNLALHVGHHASTVTEGRWSRAEDFCYWDYPLLELEDLTMGIVGYGRIGTATARLAIAFGMDVIACDRTDVASPATMVSLEDVFRRSDVVSLHCPLTPETRHMVNASRLRLMKPTAFLINTSRGGLVDEEALAEVLNTGSIAGAGIDVLSTEPPSPDNPLLHARNCFITPHIAWATRAARARLLDAVVGNIKAFLDGSPRNVVNLT